MVNGIRRVSNGVRKVSNGICGVSNGIHKVTNFQHNWFTISVRKISKRNKFEELKKKIQFPCSVERNRTWEYFDILVLIKSTSMIQNTNWMKVILMVKLSITRKFLE